MTARRLVILENDIAAKEPGKKPMAANFKVRARRRIFFTYSRLPKALKKQSPGFPILLGAKNRIRTISLAEAHSMIRIEPRFRKSGPGVSLWQVLTCVPFHGKKLLAEESKPRTDRKARQ